MRPEILFPLFRPVASLSGIGPRLAALIEKLAGSRLVDLLWHLPVGLVDRRHLSTIADAGADRIVTLRVRIDRHEAPERGAKTPYRVMCSDATGSLALIFFRARPDWVRAQLPEGSERIVSGRLEIYRGTPQIPHPDRIGTPEELPAIATVEPVYPMTADLAPKTLRKAIEQALDAAPDLPEWHDAAMLNRQGWPRWHDAIHAVHRPETAADLAPHSLARQRLAYDELLASQLALQLIRARGRTVPGLAQTGDGSLRTRLRDALPFVPTDSQEAVIAEILSDMAAPERMLRLLQGDVGAGKTVVALFAILNTLEGGRQAAVMAPTEILARQHAATIGRLLAPLGIAPVLITGRDKGRPRADKCADIAAGRAQIVIGTHALIQDDIAFADLGLAVIDEQHRFGVEQRLALSSKGRRPDVLVMTATPIPRTLTLTQYGDMDVSRLTGKPPGRQAVTTRAIPAGRLGDVIAALDRAMSAGAKAYWVCPLVEDSATVDLAAAEARHRMLADTFGAGRVALIHGRMKAAEKDAAMSAFADPAGRGPQLLVATTVIEVGVDVPEATIMVIEHAERFGLAQLHQLRGRIGRGTGASSCLLLYSPPLTETARARLKAIRDSDDGFKIAEEDLKLRGGGEVLGLRQSGLPQFRIADPVRDGDLLATAHRDAQRIVANNPGLDGPRGPALRSLLYLFDRDRAVPTLRSG